MPAVIGGAPAGAAGGGASGAAPVVPSGGSAPPPQGSGVGTPVAPIAPQGTQAGGAPPPPAPTGPKKLSRTFTENGKEVKLEASEDALWNSHRREQAVNRSFQEIKQQLAEYQKREERIARFEQFRKQGRIDQLLPEDMPHSERIRILGETLRAQMDEEERLANPEMRQLMERARNGDKAARELAQVRQAQEAREQEEHALRIQDQMAETFGSALQEVKLPHNDVTIGLMAQAHATAREMGWEITPQQLAAETMKLTGQTFDAISDNIEDPEAVLDLFPKLARKIHEGLLLRHKKKMGVTQTTPIQPPAAKKTAEDEKGTQPKILNSIEEAKAYGTKGLRSI